MSTTDHEAAVVSTWNFWLQRGHVGGTTPGLSVVFSRDQPTIDPTGQMCAATTGTTDFANARFDRPFRLSPVPAPPARLETHYSSLVLASGRTSDGSQEMMVYLNYDLPPSIRVYKSPDCDTAIVTSLDFVHIRDVGGSAKNVSNTDPRCLPLPEYNPEEQRFNPLSAVVIHGAIILAGPVLVPDPISPGDWTYGGWGFAINREEGNPTAWHWLYDDIGATPPQPDYNRGQAWCLKACPANNRVANPTQFWVCCTDYRAQPSSPLSPDRPDGGRVYVARLKRQNTSTADWQIDHPSNAFHIIDLPQGDPNTLLPRSGCHAHAAYIAEYGRTDDLEYPDVQLVVSLGDSQANNRVARFVWDDNQGNDHNFMNGWSAIGASDDFHGTKNPADDRGTWNFQPVGVGSGPYETAQVTIGDQSVSVHKPSLVWGGDVEAEWLVRMTPPVLGASTQQLTCEHLWGWSTGFGSLRSGYQNWPYFLTGTVTESRPEQYGPLVAVVYDTSTTSTSFTESIPPPYGEEAAGGEYMATRILYNPGFGPGITSPSPLAWHQVGSVRSKKSSQVTSAVYFCGNVYYTIASDADVATDFPGLYKVPVPTDFTNFEPIVISPGGDNLVHKSYNADGDPGTQSPTITPLSLQTPGVHNGIFVDGSPLPACPTMAERAYRIQTSRANAGTGTDADKIITRVHASSSSATLYNSLTPPWQVGPRIRGTRAWVYDNSFNRIFPNKTIQMSSEFLNTAGGNPNWAATTTYTCRGRWCPVTHMGYQGFNADGSGNALALGLALRSSWSGSTDPDDNDFYFVMDTARDSFGALPYPILQTDGAAVHGSDELLTVTTGSQGPVLGVSPAYEWSVRVAGMMPEGDWDQYAQRMADSPSLSDDIRTWPLYTLWADDTHYIEFRADCTQRSFHVKAVLNGNTYTSTFNTGEQFWLPGSQFYSVISFKKVMVGISIRYRFFFGASLGGGSVLAGTSITVPVWPTNGLAFTQLRFRGGPGTPDPNKPERADEVVTMRWLGGDFKTGTGSALDTDAAIKSAFSDPSLSWFKAP